MCRLFGIRSIMSSRVHSSLLECDNALMRQSGEHPDGWGVAYYLQGAPHLIKSVSAAVEDNLFRQVGGVVASHTVLAHLRKATLGQLSIVNTHPFQYGRWVFAHNGNIRDFGRYRQRLLDAIPEEYRRYILGESDSEVIFYTILATLGRMVDTSAAEIRVDDLATACREAVQAITRITGPFNPVDGPPEETYLTFIITNGHTMLAHQGGKELLYSTYKTKCPEAKTCHGYSPECEAPVTSGAVNHLVLSSENLEGENVFIAMSPGEMVGVDAGMRLRLYPTTA